MIIFAGVFMCGKVFFIIICFDAQALLKNTTALSVLPSCTSVRALHCTVHDCIAQWRKMIPRQTSESMYPHLI